MNNKKYNIIKILILFTIEIVISFIFARNNYIDLMPPVNTKITDYINNILIIWTFFLFLISLVCDKFLKKKNSIYYYLILLISLVIVGTVTYIIFLRRVY